MKHFLILIAILSISLNSRAQFSLEGEIRPRAEFRYGYRQMPSTGQKPAGHVSQRSRLTLNFKQDKITTRMSFQDIRIWGQQQQVTHAATVDLHEAWIAWAFADTWTVKAGRQEIRYDNQRFFAINDWVPTGRKHDAALLMHRAETHQTHLGFGFNQQNDPLFGTNYPLNNYKTLNYIWHHRMLSPKLSLSLLGVADGFQSPANEEVLYLRATAGSYISYKQEGSILNINPAIQGGKTREGQDIQAWYLMAEYGKQLNPSWNTTAGFELFSGNDMKNPDGKYHMFNYLYGVGHAFNGYMDYFTNMQAHTRDAGLFNPYWKNKWSLNEKIDFHTDLHLFFLQNNFVHNDEVIKKHLGTEIDLTLNYSFDKITQLMLGYSAMLGTESMEIIKGGNKDKYAHWAYITLRVRPKFL